MRSFLRRVLLNTIALFLAEAAIPGLTVKEGVGALLTTGLVLTLAHYLISPVIKLLTLPLNLITFGLLSWVNNVLVLALVVKFWDKLEIKAFALPAWHQAGFSTPELGVGLVPAYILAALALTLIYKILDQICQS